MECSDELRAAINRIVCALRVAMCSLCALSWPLACGTAKSFHFLVGCISFQCLRLAVRAIMVEGRASNTWLQKLHFHVGVLPGTSSAGCVDRMPVCP